MAPLSASLNGDSKTMSDHHQPYSPYASENRAAHAAFGSSLGAESAVSGYSYTSYTSRTSAKSGMSEEEGASLTRRKKKKSSKKDRLDKSERGSERGKLDKSERGKLDKSEKGDKKKKKKKTKRASIDIEDEDFHPSVPRPGESGLAGHESGVSGVSISLNDLHNSQYQYTSGSASNVNNNYQQYAGQYSGQMQYNSSNSQYNIYGNQYSNPNNPQFSNSYNHPYGHSGNTSGNVSGNVMYNQSGNIQYDVNNSQYQQQQQQQQQSHGQSQHGSQYFPTDPTLSSPSEPPPVQSIFDNRHHDISHHNDDQSAYSSLDDASYNTDGSCRTAEQWRQGLLSRREKLAAMRANGDMGSLTDGGGTDGGESLNGSIGGLSWRESLMNASWTGSWRKRRKSGDKKKSKKKSKEKKKKSSSRKDGRKKRSGSKERKKGSKSSKDKEKGRDSKDGKDGKVGKDGKDKDREGRSHRRHRSPDRDHSLVRGDRGPSLIRGESTRDHSLVRRRERSPGRGHSLVRGESTRDHSLVRRERNRDHSLIRREDTRDHSLVRRESTRDHSLVRRERTRDGSLIRRESTRDHSLIRRESTRDHSLVKRESTRDHSLVRREKRQQQPTKQKPGKPRDDEDERRTKSKGKPQKIMPKDQLKQKPSPKSDLRKSAQRDGQVSVRAPQKRRPNKKNHGKKDDSSTSSSSDDSSSSSDSDSSSSSSSSERNRRKKRDNDDDSNLAPMRSDLVGRGTHGRQSSEAMLNALVKKDMKHRRRRTDSELAGHDKGGGPKGRKEPRPSTDLGRSEPILNHENHHGSRRGSDLMKKIPSLSLKNPTGLLHNLSGPLGSSAPVMDSSSNAIGDTDQNLSSNHVVYYACDENTGCCVFHPDVQLRKRARFGGWKDVLRQCPKCAVAGNVGLVGATGNAAVPAAPQRTMSDGRTPPSSDRMREKHHPSFRAEHDRSDGRLKPSRTQSQRRAHSVSVSRQDHNHRDLHRNGTTKAKRELSSRNLERNRSAGHTEVHSKSSSAKGNDSGRKKQMEPKGKQLDSFYDDKDSRHASVGARPVENSGHSLPPTSKEIRRTHTSMRQEKDLADNRHSLKSSSTSGGSNLHELSSNRLSLKSSTTSGGSHPTIPSLRSSLQSQTSSKKLANERPKPLRDDSIRSDPSEKFVMLEATKKETISPNPYSSQELSIHPDESSFYESSEHPASSTSYSFVASEFSEKLNISESKTEKTDQTSQPYPSATSQTSFYSNSAGSYSKTSASHSNMSPVSHKSPYGSEKTFYSGSQQSPKDDQRSLETPLSNPSIPSIQSARKTVDSHESFDEKVEDNPSPAIDLGVPSSDSEGSELACCLMGGGKAHNEEGLYGFFKDKVEQTPPQSKEVMRSLPGAGTVKSEVAPALENEPQPHGQHERGRSFTEHINSTAPNVPISKSRFKSFADAGNENRSGGRSRSRSQSFAYSDSRERSLSKERINAMKGMSVEDLMSFVMTKKTVSGISLPQEQPQQTPQASVENNSEKNQRALMREVMMSYMDDEKSGCTSPEGKTKEVFRTHVTHLPWAGSDKTQGVYTGFVNQNFEPDGEGELVFPNGSYLHGEWENGQFNGDANVNEKDSVIEEDTPSYAIGDAGRRRDMIKDHDVETAQRRIANLRTDEFAFVRRTDGSWSYAKVKKVTPHSIVFIVNNKGSTKSYEVRYWHSHVRVPRVSQQASHGKRSSSVDSRASSVESSQQANSNRFSTANLKTSKMNQTEDDSEKDASEIASEKDAASGSQSSRPNGILRKSRSFLAREKTAKRRSVSFSPARVPDIEPRIKNEYDVDDYDDTITGRGYDLRGLDP